MEYLWLISVVAKGGGSLCAAELTVTALTLRRVFHCLLESGVLWNALKPAP